MDTIKTTQDLLKFNGSAQSVMVKLTEKDKSLIASAPELLEALEHLIACADCKAPELPEALEYAKQAIAKATGGNV